MQAKVEHIYIEDNRRIIVISDIHGDLDSLKQLLAQAQFSPMDILILGGDMVEKGLKSLQTLQYIMNLCKTHTVYAVCGNCDAISKSVYQTGQNKELLTYLLIQKNTLLNEMCKVLSITLTADSDMLQIKEKLKQNFAEEFKWIMDLPDIIDTQNFIFAHAGISNDMIEKQKLSFVHSVKAYHSKEIFLNKYCIVGHWPVTNYNKKLPNSNPIIDKIHKIISIDGGNVLKTDGQLNALIIPNINSDNFTFEAYDQLKCVFALDAQEESKDSYHIPWTDNLITIIEAGGEFSYCEQISTKKKMWILNKHIYKDKHGCYRCEGSTDYQLSVKAGDCVKLVETTKKGYLIKKDGITGWYFGKLKIEENGSEETYD